MAGYNIHDQKRNKAVLSVVAASILFVICVLFILMLHNSLQQKASLEITQRYRTFESKVERLIYSNTILLEGFQAYISGNPNMDTEEAYGYLDRLLAGNLEYIRNIGVMEDTTMQWNYPREGNSQVIGVDLATLEGQREWVLKVKQTGLPLLQGPIDLVQGDSGFSVRIPIFLDGDYWGQTSIVLKTSKVMEAINRYASDVDITLAIYSDGKETPFMGPSEPFESELVFHMDPSFINWHVHVRLSGGLGNNLPLLALMLVFSAILSTLAGMFFYQHLSATRKILDMSTHDHLTGLFNRHFLSEYQMMVISEARREQRKAAILLMDLNCFKSINDTYGHQVGDMALVETARVLKRFTRTGETTFRLGGDEFLIFIPRIEDAQTLQGLRNRLERFFQQEFEIPGHPIKMAFGMGTAVFPEDADDFDALLRVADRRLYEDKAANKKSCQTPASLEVPAIN